MAEYIFGGNTGMTAEQLAERRRIAASLARSGGAPGNVGEGLNRIGEAIAYRMMMRQNRDAEARLAQEAQLAEGGPVSFDALAASRMMPDDEMLSGGAGSDMLMGGGGGDMLGGMIEPAAPDLGIGNVPYSQVGSESGRVGIQMNGQPGFDRPAGPQAMPSPGMVPEMDMRGTVQFPGGRARGGLDAITAGMSAPQGPNVGTNPMMGAAMAAGGYRAPVRAPAPPVDEDLMGAEMEFMRREFERQPRDDKGDRTRRQATVQPLTTEEGRAVSTPSAGAGEAYIPDPSSPTGFRAVPVPGSRAEREVQAEQEREALRQSTTGAYSDAFFDNLDRARDMVGQTWATTGGLGALLDDVPGTSAHNLQNLLLPVQAGLAFDRLQAMRDMSPTGGALGQVSERELALLQNSIASLELSQSEDQLLRNMAVVEDAYNRIIHGPPPASVTPEQWREFHRQNRNLVRRGQAPSAFGASAAPRDLSAMSDEDLLRALQGGN